MTRDTFLTSKNTEINFFKKKRNESRKWDLEIRK